MNLSGKKKLFFASVFAAGFFLSARAYSASTMVSANISFDTALVISKNNDIDFGIVKASTSGTYTIDTTGAVTPSNGGETVGGSHQAGNINLTGSASQMVDISATNYAANNGVTPSNATCSYNGGAAAACSLTSQTPPGAGKTLLVGVQVAADGTQTAGTSATPTFDIVINYH